MTTIDGQSSGIEHQGIYETNGLEEYWNPNKEELFQIFKKEYWDARKVDHLEEITEHVLFVRLENNARRMDALKKAGKKKALSKLMKKNEKINRSIVRSMEEHYSKGQYYFYYPEDAESIFEGKDYSKLYVNLTEKATGVSIDKIAYVMMYRRAPGRHQKSFCLHIWDKSKIYILRKHFYLTYKSWFSTKVDYPRSFMIFCRDIDDALSDN